MAKAELPDPKSPGRMAFVLIPRFNMMTLTTVIEPMRIANYLAPRNLYEWRFFAPEAGDIVASNGMAQNCAALPPDNEAFDSIFLLGSWGAEHDVQANIVNWLRRRERRGSRICAIEIGVFILARAGLLTERTATTHWSCLAGLAERFPDIALCEQLFTEDRNLLTCAGGTAGLDIMLHLIGKEHGAHLASEVADQILHHPTRSAETLQRHTLSCATSSLHPAVEKTIKLIEVNIGDPLSMPEVAQRAGLSQRQLERLFKRDMGCSVARFSQLARLQYARVLLTTTRMSIREVSVASGFNSLTYFSQAFVRCFEKKPSEYRQAWPDREPTPSWPGTVFSLIESTRRRARQAAGDATPP